MYEGVTWRKRAYTKDDEDVILKLKYWAGRSRLSVYDTKIMNK